MKQKKYNGKVDRVAINNFFKEEWNKISHLNRNSNTLTSKYLYKEWEMRDKAEKDFDNTKNLHSMQKMRNIRKPIPHYKKL